jgi:hypothetical protein
MSLFLKNDTSDVPVSTTLHRIEQVLIRCGVCGITKEYSDTQGTIAAVTFSIAMGEGHPMTIRLPAKVNEAQDALWRDYAGADISPDGKTCHSPYKKKTKGSFREQAERTAWKLVQDWIEVQMSMVQLKQADVREVFLAYVWNGRETFFSRLQANGFRALLPEKTE